MDARLEFEGYAVGLSGRLGGESIPSQAATVLAPSGGWNRASVSNFVAPGISIGAATSETMGEFDAAAGQRRALVRFEVEGLRLVDRIEAAHISAALELTFRPDSETRPQIAVRQISIYDYRIDGRSVRFIWDWEKIEQKNNLQDGSLVERMDFDYGLDCSCDRNRMQIPGLGLMSIADIAPAAGGLRLTMLRLNPHIDGGAIEVGTCAIGATGDARFLAAPHVRTLRRSHSGQPGDGNLRELVQAAAGPDPAEQKRDLAELERQDIYLARELLAARPSRVMRSGVIRWDNLALYRAAALEFVEDQSRWARRRLSHLGWPDAAIAKLSGEAAIRVQSMIERRERDRVETICQMADVLERELLLELSRQARLDRRRAHASEAQSALLGALELNPTDIFQAWLSNQFIAELNEFQIRRAAEDSRVRSISATLPLRACVDEGLARVSATSLRSGAQGKDEIVALIDSGVDDTHPDLTGRIVHKYDYTGRGFSDEHGHGTHLAGIIASNGSAYGGAAPKATVWSYRVLNEKGESASSGDAIKAIHDVVADAAALGRIIVVNGSLEIPHGAGSSDADYDALCDAFDDATTDVIVVVAAGNSGPAEKSITAPGGGNDVITVGASVNRPAGWPDVFSPFSSRGPGVANRLKPDVVAPGGFENQRKDAYQDVSMVSCRLKNGTLDLMTGVEKPWPVDSNHHGLSGTSQATAIVSGICALLIGEMTRNGRTITHHQVASALKKSARPLGYGKYEEGKGLVDADEALKVL